MQQTLITRIEKSFAHKKISKEYNDQFEQILKTQPIGDISFARVTMTKEKKLRVNLINKNPSEQESVFSSVVSDFIKKNISKINGPFDFFIHLDNGIQYEDTIISFIKNHIILLNPYSISGREGMETLIPDYYILQKGFRKNFINAYKNTIPFLERTPTAKFRGSQTGGAYTMDAVKKMEFPRLKGAHLSLKYPDLLDIRFINTYSLQSDNSAEYINYMTKTFGLPAGYEDMKDQNKFRYLICFDGNHAPPFARPETIMASGSVPLFQTKYENFWISLLIDGVNYMKINNDLSNLVDTVRDLNAHPEYAQKIAGDARKLAEEVLMPEFMDRYLITVLNKVSDFQKNKIK
ncbi:MAG: glycosyl transferase family 90 [Candidatus Paracaedibacteraceae bacterium]|nr:glycosyl transferase family 90 [Candidatus Paracaedibacteraceae bacterium]